MKVALSVLCQDLPCSQKADPFAVVVRIPSDPNQPPVLVGKSETVYNSTSPDFCTLFVLQDFELGGRPCKVAITIKDESSTKTLGAAIFDVGRVLASPGGTLGKELKQGGILIVSVEAMDETTNGSLTAQLCGIQLKNTDGIIRKSDPFFEIQRARKAASSQAFWDCVFRSRPIHNNLNPTWDAFTMELGPLCGGNLTSKAIRIAVYDYSTSGKYDDMGHVDVSVQDLLDHVSPDKDQSFVLKNGTQEVGKLAVLSASVEGHIESSAEEVSNVETDTDIVVSFDDISQDIEIAPHELDPPTFVDYVKGGCELKVSVAIDFGSSNGDPRKEGSLHYYYRDERKNVYEMAMEQICTILAEYDSDQKYPVWGFGAKKDGALNQCFSCAGDEEVEGVDGILQAYKKTFQSGIAMSQPSDMKEVIGAAGARAEKDLATAMESGIKAYSILLIFTTGTIHDASGLAAAMDNIAKHPLSIVIVGVGGSDLQNDNTLRIKSSRDFVTLVDFDPKASDASVDSALKAVPEQMVAFFVGRDLFPDAESSNIVVEPPDEIDEQDAVSDIVIGENGSISIGGLLQGSSTTTSTASAQPSGGSGLGRKAHLEMLKQGKRIMNRQKRVFGRMRRQYQRQVDRMVDGKIKNLLPKF